MKRQVQASPKLAAILVREIPDGIFLVRVDGAWFRWHARKPFYVLRLSILEPIASAGQCIVGSFWCTQESDVEAGLVPAGFSL